MPTNLPDPRLRARAARAELDFAFGSLLVGVGAIVISLALLTHLHFVFTGDDMLEKSAPRGIIAPAKR